jgi:hypothetical protein
METGQKELNQAKFIARLLADCTKSPVEFSKFCKTRDEHDLDNPIKQYPVKEKEYLGYMLNELATNSVVFIPKSRQVLVTWSCCLYILWVAMFNPHRLIFVQSKKQEDAAELVSLGEDKSPGRIQLLYEYLPEWLKIYSPLITAPRYSRIEFKNGSKITGIAQGPDVLRQYTASVVYITEMAFQVKAREAYIALRPTLQSGKPGAGQLIVDSTPNFKEVFYSLIYENDN